MKTNKKRIILFCIRFLFISTVLQAQVNRPFSGKSSKTRESGDTPWFGRMIENQNTLYNPTVYIGLGYEYGYVFNSDYDVIELGFYNSFFSKKMRPKVKTGFIFGGGLSFYQIRYNEPGSYSNSYYYTIDVMNIGIRNIYKLKKHTLESIILGGFIFEPTQLLYGFTGKGKVVYRRNHSGIGLQLNFKRTEGFSYMRNIGCVVSYDYKF